MTPARFFACKRLLRGITILEARHKDLLLALSTRRSSLQSELERLAKVIAEQNYADSRLLLPMSRRIGAASINLKQVQQDLLEAYRKEAKLSRAKQLLVERIVQHEMEQEEEKLGELVSEMISSTISIQSSARK